MVETGDVDGGGRPTYWLVDGGPVTMHPETKARDPPLGRLNPYYQCLQAALRRYCSDANGRITRLKGIIVTHTDGDHMQGEMEHSRLLYLRLIPLKVS